MRKICLCQLARVRQKAIELINKHDCLRDTVARAEHYASIARDALAPAPDTPEKDAMLEVIAFCLTRAN